jgi:transketolase
MNPLADKPQRDALITTVASRMGANKDFFFLSADMGAPALDGLRADYPDRFINVGIAEQNLINVAAGLAMEGFTVFTYAIAPFYMRAYEQIRINLALPAQLRPMNVNMIALGAGISYDVSGPTHHCLEDLTIMRALPNLVTISPADSVTALAVADFAPTCPQPKYIRLDGKSHKAVGGDSVDLSKGFRVLVEGGQVTITATGVMLNTALDVAKRFPGQVSVVDVFRLDDGMDRAGLAATLAKASAVVTLEEGFTGRGGLDALVASVLKGSRPQLALGMRSEFDMVPGSRASLHVRNGIGPDQVAEVVKGLL